MKNALTVLASTAVYGAVLGMWRSPLMAAYVAAKLPVVFFGAMLAVSAFCWVVSLALDADMRYRDVWSAASDAMATAGRVLFAAAPVVLFFVATAAPDSGRATRCASRIPASCSCISRSSPAPGRSASGAFTDGSSATPPRDAWRAD